MSHRWWMLVLLVVILAGIGGYLYSQNHQTEPVTSAVTSAPVATSESITSRTIAPATSAPSFYYPITGYPTRLTNRHYGQPITAADSKTLPCGAQFSGIHDGDDVEVTTDELTKDIPVYAIADGTVRQVGHVNGYGGLLIIQHELNSQTVTANYGHIDLSRTTVKAGDTVTAGQLVTYLGDACSAQTDNERKHLHFAIHQGTDIDVKGYVQTASELKNWLNPAATLQLLGAVMVTE